MWTRWVQMPTWVLDCHAVVTALLLYSFPPPVATQILISCPCLQVAQLAAYVSEHSAYHHGETSLATTIVNLAQDFVGSNNINLLQPSGQFGTRLQVWIWSGKVL